MASVKPFTDLSTAPNGCFSFVPSTTSVTINYDHPDGVREYLDFEAFSHPSGTIIRFPQEPEFGFTPWNLRVILDSGDVHLLQWGAYEDNFDAWENNPLSPHSFLALMKSRDLRVTESARVLPSHRRCDNQTYGPSVGYFPQDGIKPSSMDVSVIKNYNASLFRPVLSANTVAHITHFNFHGIYMSWRNWPIVTLAARTLSGALRQASEWRDLYIAGISTESVAKDCFDYFEMLGITQSMIDELKVTEVMMPVERFIRGHGDARHGFSETGVLPESLKNHLMRQLTYKNLSVLEAKHPDHPQIDTTLKLEERKIHQFAVYEYIIEYMPWVSDPDSVTVDMVYSEIIFGRDSYRAENGFGPIHPVDKPLQEKALLGARYFDATK